MVTPEPEKIKVIAIPAFFIMALIFGSFMIENSIQGAEHYDASIPRPFFDWNNTFLFFGMSLFGYEAVGTIFTVRNCMATPKKLPKIIVGSFSIIGFMFVSIGKIFFPFITKISRVQLLFSLRRYLEDFCLEQIRMGRLQIFLHLEFRIQLCDFAFCPVLYNWRVRAIGIL
jgi:hypothetical protein